MSAPKATQNASVGRFQLRRQLGRGAQSIVWLAFDPRLEREVAVKLLRQDSLDSVNECLHEARSVGRLKHPCVVPLFEADVHEQQPYLVFEYVPGQTLSEHLRNTGKMSARDAVEMVISVLDALQAAHDAGVVHRDLKPSNILLDERGRARVMDFGIAARLQHPGTKTQVVGTPGYMSPEAAHGAMPTPAMDLFSVALVLAEMLSGKPLIAEDDPYRAIYRVAHEDLVLPALVADADDALGALVLRNLSRIPAQRHASAAEFRDALQHWCAPALHSDGTPAGGGTLEFLLRRMRHKSDFPALSDAIVRIQRVANSDSESVSSLSGEILKDVALTHKLLRLVNTVQYRAVGGDTISTVSRAVAIIGFAGVRNLALSLVLLEHMHDKVHANQLKEQFLRSLMAASVASELCGTSRDDEEAFIAAMFQNLGKLLTEFYFPEEAGQIRRAMNSTVSSSAGTVRSLTSEAAAAVSVLGLSFDDLGVGVAKAWGLPEALQRCMRKPQGAPPAKACDKVIDRLHWLAAAANEVTDALLQAEPGQASASLARVADRYGRALSVNSRDVQAAAACAQQRLVEIAQAMNLRMQPGSPMKKLLGQAGHGSSALAPADELSLHQLHATLPVSPAAQHLQGSGDVQAQAAADMLAAGIQDITNSMVEDFNLNEVLRMILETMLRALEFRRIVFCLRDPKTETLTGRLGLGHDIEGVVGKFKIRLRPDARHPFDLFSAVCLKGSDTLIADSTTPGVASRLPTWYVQAINAPAFLLLPLQMKGAPFALIYADKAQPGGIELAEKELSMLRTLRNQAVMAFKQST